MVLEEKSKIVLGNEMIWSFCKIFTGYYSVLIALVWQCSPTLVDSSLLLGTPASVLSPKYGTKQGKKRERSTNEDEVLNNQP